jgi:hypothetical protein
MSIFDCESDMKKTRWMLRVFNEGDNPPSNATMVGVNEQDVLKAYRKTDSVRMSESLIKLGKYSTKFNAIVSATTAISLNHQTKMKEIKKKTKRAPLAIVATKRVNLSHDNDVVVESVTETGVSSRGRIRKMSQAMVESVSQQGLLW